jgi:hypothetical protein
VQGYLRVGVPDDKLNYLAVILLLGAARADARPCVWAPIGVAAAIGVICYFLTAVTVHIRANDPRNLPVPVVYLTIATVVLVMRLATFT